MHESGLMNKWITEQIPTKNKCSYSSANQAVNERKVNITDMQGIFFVLFMGKYVSVNNIIPRIDEYPISKEVIFYLLFF
jgi:hypothetical protein